MPESRQCPIEAARLRRLIADLSRDGADPTIIERAYGDLAWAESGDMLARVIADAPGPTPEQAERLRGLLWGTTGTPSSRRESAQFKDAA
jgi:hypothetical protein